MVDLRFKALFIERGEKDVIEIDWEDLENAFFRCRFEGESGVVQSRRTVDTSSHEATCD